ncbi:hypothetical protein SELMODRAFT_413911 [Selaginella moellendorffii]|uniref:F-box domain-containing protein n=1 Tax=Selaginella moellendorffii TaxID=88036 RepID=D8RR10_SELML|nr:hypothetical protein SELMODRAFT_413911 [Selaginella moellendorffii]
MGRGRSQCDIPDELLDEVFIRLPLQWIVTARSVCRRWRRKLCCKSFLAKHDLHGPQQRWIIVDYFLNSKGFLGAFNTVGRKWLAIPVLLPPRTRNLSLLCGSQGFLCFLDRQKLHARHVHLYNPVTKQWLKVPLPRSISPLHLHLRIYGTRGSNHFKLLMLDQTCDLVPVASLYDSRTRKWRPLNQALAASFFSLWDNLVLSSNGIYDLEKEEWRLSVQIPRFRTSSLLLRRDGGIFKARVLVAKIKLFQLSVESMRDELVAESTPKPWCFFNELDNVWIVSRWMPAIIMYEASSEQWRKFDYKWSGFEDRGIAECCNLSFHQFPHA